MPNTLSKEQLLSLYRSMLTIRRTEEQLARSYQAGHIPGACHTYVGEEAIAAGVCAHLDNEDAVFSTHRGHGHALAKGVPVRELIAELHGKATGCSQGRGGSMHLFSPEVGLMGTSGIVGPSILQATGAAYAFQLRNLPHVGVAFFGDGGVSNGAFHEGLNMAAIWQLPVLFVLEDNRYATEVAFEYASRNTNVAERAKGYGVPGITVDGNNVLDVYRAAGEAVKRAREGGGPTLLDCKTYRTRPHAEGMRDGGYRSVEEMESWKARDPIDTLGKQLIEDGTVAQNDLDGIENEIKLLVGDGVEFARTSPWPDPATLTDHIFSHGA
ncbi:MAG: thiamine pyrophosphate-dependent dehydrogenase E1 component subunit alpha [bacterium]|nr:thiamine pyrophosphate-dependent dehydrogenase E1 component subunit alpha [bacterium]